MGRRTVVARSVVATSLLVVALVVPLRSSDEIDELLRHYAKPTRHYVEISGGDRVVEEIALPPGPPRSSAIYRWLRAHGWTDNGDEVVDSGYAPWVVMGSPESHSTVDVRICNDGDGWMSRDMVPQSLVTAYSRDATPLEKGLHGLRKLLHLKD